MNIGIDLDGVLTNYRKFAIDAGSEYCEENNKEKMINPKAYYVKDIFGWDEKTELDFWKNNIFEYAENNPVLDGAAENIKKLKEDGNNIYIITARKFSRDEKEYNIKLPENIKEKMRNTVKEWLSRNDIIYDKLIFSKEDKSEYILENKIDVMIEDSPNNLKGLSKLTKMICVDWPYNEEVKNDNIYRCYNWNEIYEKIKELQETAGK